jgi:hypothetical protein
VWPPPLTQFSKQTTKLFSKPKTFLKEIKHNIFKEIIKKKKKSSNLKKGHVVALKLPPDHHHGCGTSTVVQHF